MKQIKRIISLCLILCICISGVQVNADNRYTEQSLEIESVSGTETYKVLNVDNRIYMSASDFGKITRYEYKEGPDNVLYTLGDKFVSVSKNEGKLSLPMQNYSTKCSKTVSYNGNTYIAMDELLPWLNVECSVVDNKLIVASDAISMWELTDVLINNFETYKFNLYKDLGETNASSVGLAAAMMFDTIVNVRFDKLIPVGDSILDPAGSLYDRDCYRDLYIDMATDDTLLSAQADKVFKKAFEINKNIGTIEKALGIDEDKLSKQGDQFLLDLGVGAETMSDYATLSETWRGTRKALTSVSKASKYFNPFKILKSYETVLHTTTEYRNYLKDITYDSKQNSVMQTAIREASIRLDESKGAVYSYLIDLGNELVVGTTEDAYKKIIETAFEGKSWGSIFLYLDLAKIFYSTIVPVTDGMSEMSKFIIYSNVSDYSWDKAYEYAGKELTQDNIAFMCQSYMASLKSSKKAFEGMQTLFDSKAFGFSMFGNNDGLMDHRIEPTEEMLAQLALTSSCRENDSTENKDKKAKEIRELLSALVLENSEQITEFDIEQHMGLWFYTPFSDPKMEDLDGMDIRKTGINEAEILYCDQLTKIVFVSDNVAESERFGPSNEYKNKYTFRTDYYGKATIDVDIVYADTGEIAGQTSSAYRNKEDFFFDTNTVNSTSNEILGLWSHSEYSDNYSVLIFDEKQDTVTVSITAIRGNAAQIATANVENVKFIDGVANFRVVDSFGNKADCCIKIKNGKLTITYTNEQLKEYANWGVVLTPEGHYIKTDELSDISEDWLKSIRQEIEWAKSEGGY